MTIKKFSSFVLEKYNASDLVGDKDSDDEVKDYKPRSKGEVDFKNLHKINKTKHPVASERQFTSEQAEEDIEEAMWPGTPEYKAKFGTDKEKHELKFGKSDVKKLKPYGYRDDPEDSPVSSQGKGRGRPKKVKEEVEIEEDVLSDLKKIVEKKQTMSIKFANGKMEQVDLQSANAVLSLHKKVNEQNKLKIERMVNSSPTNFIKVFELAIGDVK